MIERRFVVAYLKVMAQNSPGETEEDPELVRIAGNLVQIRTDVFVIRVATCFFGGEGRVKQKRRNWLGTVAASVPAHVLLAEPISVAGTVHFIYLCEVSPILIILVPVFCRDGTHGRD
jgi:hypothetical protein